jgi:hypothetical protein
MKLNENLNQCPFAETPSGKGKLAILISGFRRDVDEICALLGYYAASCGICLPTFRDNVGKQLPQDAA